MIPHQYVRLVLASLPPKTRLVTYPQYVDERIHMFLDAFLFSGGEVAAVAQARIYLGPWVSPSSDMKAILFVAIHGIFLVRLFVSCVCFLQHC